MNEFSFGYGEPPVRRPIKKGCSKTEAPNTEPDFNVTYSKLIAIILTPCGVKYLFKKSKIPKPGFSRVIPSVVSETFTQF